MNNFTKKISFREFIQLVESHTNFHAKRTASGYSLRCPAHDDKNPSLSACEGDDGTILLKCFRECSFNEICKALNIDPSSLFPIKPNSHAPCPSNIKTQPSEKKIIHIMTNKAICCAGNYAFLTRMESDSNGNDMMLKEMSSATYRDVVEFYINFQFY